ncbi:hypothetical protein JWG42_08575 [Desulfoprunum benzoelyticum]|jgi:hypothetical protein|uniref:Alpha/beta hydrolase n=1 Tax=Desulfoprunum benzoelyticum TaxID=1506996 RepID=A0A840URQ6_9BACT|nr:hypothetical protein [Desulfoprunum benzoelyticum]MBB5348462.1 hypothetical protein [Desulfoprunum benzoelyticum]MBM9530203.1 hypothetical protein [Desulfoprunum benzoelyticum]
MHIYALPGINQKTEKWATNLLKELEGPDRTMTVQHYAHWDGGGEQCLDLKGEIESLNGRDIDLLIAKSLGVMIALIACDKGIIAPKKMVLIGTPVTGFREKGLDLRQLAAGPDIPLLFIQQAQDIVGSCASLRQEISGMKGAEIVEIPGDNHQYKDLKLLARHIKKLL